MMIVRFVTDDLNLCDIFEVIGELSRKMVEESTKRKLFSVFKHELHVCVREQPSPL